MALNKSTEEEIKKKYRLHEKDTGSADVQIAVYTERIVELTEHLKRHPHDKSCRLALFKLIGNRRRLLTYLLSTDTERYHKLIERLNIQVKQLNKLSSKQMNQAEKEHPEENEAVKISR